MKFTELPLDEELQDAIYYMGFEEATPIQEQAIPAILDDRDVLGCAQTGTGKTGAFLIPVIQKLSGNVKHQINTLIIVPTRELALQIDNQIQALGYFAGISSIPIYGGGDGSDWTQQKRAIKSGVDIIVATPGKLIGHLNMGYVDLKTVQHVILDEADRMLDMGFKEDIERIFKFLPKQRQNLLFSATMPGKIKELAKKLLVDPVEIKLAVSKPAEGVMQIAYLAHDAQKTPLIVNLLSNQKEQKSVLIFCSSKKGVSELNSALQRSGLDVKKISSDLEQKERERVMAKFRAGSVKVLVATDVISRGIDISDIDLVINYDVPSDAADYVHRIGRTARAKKSGIGITLINEDDMYKFIAIEKLIESEIRKLPLPKSLGEGPKWNPKARKKRQGRSTDRGKRRYNKKRNPRK